MKNIEMSLTTGVPYHSGGGVETAKFLTIKEPKGRDAHNCAIIRQIVTQATQEVSLRNQDSTEVKKEEDQDAKISGSDWLAMIYTTNVDVSKLTLACVELLTSIGLLDGEITLTKPLLNEMSHTDIEMAKGAIIENFIAPSILEA